MKKKILAVVLSVVMCFAITACGDKETSTTNAEPTSEAQEDRNEAQESEEVSSEVQESEEEPSSEEVAPADEANTEEADTEEADAEEAENADVEIKVEIPDGFTEVTDGMYMAEDGANIIVLTTPGAGEIPSEEAIVDQLKATLGDEAEITVDEYEVYKVGDYDALRFSASYLMENMECTQTQCMVFADGVIGMAAFTQQKDGAWTDVFKECIDSITME